MAAFDRVEYWTALDGARLALRREPSAGQRRGAVILVHGFPDDIRTWDAVVEALVGVGYRTLVPYVRGFGPTRFRNPTTVRAGQIAALGQDLLDFADALRIERFAIVGHDWGGRAAYVVAALWPERVRALVAISVPMHTALRLALPLMARLQGTAPGASIACFGLYAPLHAAVLREAGARWILGAEAEEDLVKLARGEAPEAPRLHRLPFLPPARDGLPALDRYAKLLAGGEEVGRLLRGREHEVQRFPGGRRRRRGDHEGERWTARVVLDI